MLNNVVTLLLSMVELALFKERPLQVNERYKNEDKDFIRSRFDLSICMSHHCTTR